MPTFNSLKDDIFQERLRLHLEEAKHQFIIQECYKPEPTIWNCTLCHFMNYQWAKGLVKDAEPDICLCGTVAKPTTSWECTRCGCSDEIGIDGERICGCDTCHKGCETSYSRIKRGAKRSPELEKAKVIFRILADKWENLCTLDKLQQTEECTRILEYLYTLDVPENLVPSKEYAMASLTKIMDTNDKKDLTIFDNTAKWLQYGPFHIDSKEDRITFHSMMGRVERYYV